MGFFDTPIKSSKTTPQTKSTGGFFDTGIMPSMQPKASDVPVKPTLGQQVVGFGKEILKDPLSALLITPAARATEAVTRTVFPDSLAAKGYEAMQSEGQSQNFNVPVLGNVEVPQQKAFGQGGAEQIAGQALHAASYLAPYSKIADVIGGAATPLITSLGSKAIIPTAKLVGEIGAGVAGGVGFGAGQSMEQGGSASDVLKNAALTGLIGGVIPAVVPALRNVFKKSPTPEEFFAKAFEKSPYTVPEAGTPPPGYFDKTLLALPAPRTPGEIPIELPGRGILKSAEDLRKLPTQVQEQIQKSPIEKRAEWFNSRQDFVNNEKAIVAKVIDINKSVGKFRKGFKAVEVPQKYTDKQLIKIWNDIHASTPLTPLPPLDNQIITPKINIPKETTPIVNTNIPKVEQPKLSPIIDTPEAQAQVERIVKDTQASTDPLVFESTGIAERTQIIQSLSLEHRANVLAGTEKPVQGTTFADYWRVASDTASQTGDAQALKDLGFSAPKQVVQSQTGKELGAFSRIDQQNPASIISKIVEDKIGKLPGRIVENKSAELTSTIDNLKAIFNKVTTSSKEDILSVIESMKC